MPVLHCPGHEEPFVENPRSLQAETLTSWATIAVFLLAAAGRTAGQVVDPAVRAQVVTEFQQQVSLQQTALIAQLAPNQAFGGVISQAFQTLQAMTSFGVTLNTAQVRSSSGLRS